MKITDLSQPLEIVRIIHSYDPCLACAVHVMDTKGNITQVVSSGGGLVIPNTKPPGSSRIRGYASLNTVRIGLNTGDYKTRSDSTGCSGGSCNPAVQIIKLCDCIPSSLEGSTTCSKCNPHVR